jgi:hypothetical protein
LWQWKRLLYGKVLVTEQEEDESSCRNMKTAYHPGHLLEDPIENFPGVDDRR